VKLTKEEKAWVAKLNKVLAECPSTRLGFATIGDPDIMIYDRSERGKIDQRMDRCSWDFCAVVDEMGLLAEEVIKFPNAVESTAG